MSGETNLKQMLATLQPTLDPRRFVFASFPTMTFSDAEKYNPVGLFIEKEGITVIAEPSALEDVEELPRFAMISITVHSSLEAVGLTAAMSRVLTDHGISANVVAAAFHDHIFVPAKRADDAMTALQSLRD